MKYFYKEPTSYQAARQMTIEMSYNFFYLNIEKQLLKYYLIIIFILFNNNCYGKFNAAGKMSNLLF